MSVILMSTGLDGAQGVMPTLTDEVTTHQARNLALAKAKLAACISQTLPGLPFIYYGEELGMTGRRYRNDDIARRDCFPWATTPGIPTTFWTQQTGKIEPGQNSLTVPLSLQLVDKDSLVNLYRGLALLRQKSPAIRRGKLIAMSQESLPGFQNSSILAWLREDPAQRVLVVHNLGMEPFYTLIPHGITLKAIWTSIDPLNSAASSLQSGEELTVPALASAVFELL